MDKKEKYSFTIDPFVMDSFRATFAKGEWSGIVERLIEEHTETEIRRRFHASRPRHGAVTGQ